jgi:hypothetical protein
MADKEKDKERNLEAGLSARQFTARLGALAKRLLHQGRRSGAMYPA